MTEPELSPRTEPCLLGAEDVAELVRLTQDVARSSGVAGRPRFHPDPEGIDEQVLGPLRRTSLHRAYLGMSIDPVLQGRGVGRRLLEHVIHWAQANGLAWIDLGVFAENEPAIRPYERLGFKRTGALEDVFRLPGGDVHDIRMSLDLRSLPPVAARPSP